MNGNKKALTAFFLLAANSSWSCATCGQNQTFTPATLLISFGFFLLPITMVSWIGWKLYKDSKSETKKSVE